jgi:photosystem II stability/assembly factor-like uncharacterized protein
MFDEFHGWSTSADGVRVLRTTHGPTSWQEVTPPHTASSSSDSSYIHTATFLDMQHAWVVWPITTMRGGILITRTLDGGDTWQHITLSIQNAIVRQISFLTPQIGWLLLERNNPHQHASELELLQTRDGGATWTPASRPDTRANKQNIPNGLKSSFSFISPSTGWLIGSALYCKTQDGGQTWQKQTLPFPLKRHEHITIHSPIFLNKQDGILPVSFVIPGTAILNLYLTHDGGNTWQRTTPIPGIATALATLGPRSIWAAGLTNQGVELYVTQDSALSWKRTSFTPQRPLTSIAQLQFATPQKGWLLAYAQSETVLYQSFDGGNSWQLVIPILQQPLT